MIVFTGLSGSGKSSLAFDTIFAEGQRRYVESLSSYARQFLGQMDKEDVDLFAELQSKGFARARVDGTVHALTEPPKLKKQEKHTIEVVVDRLAVKANAKQRMTDSIETALKLAAGIVVLEFVDLPEDD